MVVTQDVGASQQAVWDVLVDWDRHEEWMLLTRAQGGAHVGAHVEAFSGVGRLGFLDPMTIVVWEPPMRAVVRHTGSVVRGSGSFEVQPLGPDRSRIVWSEWILLPWGQFGHLGWPLARPLLRAGVSLSLRRLASLVEGRR